MNESEEVRRLREQIMELGPWHLEVEVTPEISTKVALEAPAGAYSPDHGRVSFISPRQSFQELIRRVYPNGLEGRSVMDCACNCGGYLFWAKELGASECFGFDVREHWIDQARFLQENRKDPGSRIRFEVCDLYDLPRIGLKPFDVTVFKGIFYHLPDPITGLKIAADLTGELIILDTATRKGLPDGMLAVSEEGRQQLMSGVYGLNWFPTGPEVLRRILEWMGFPETRCVYWHKEGTSNQAPTLGRLMMLGARRRGLLANYDATEPEPPEGAK